MNDMEQITEQDKFKQYQDIDALNWSTAKHYFKSPAHVKAYMDQPDKDTDAMRLGRLQHMALLEPERFADECIAQPDFGYLKKHDASGTTKEQGAANKAHKKAWEEENKGRVHIPADDYKHIRGMCSAVWKHSETATLLKGVTQTEHILHWQDVPTGVWCKGLADALIGEKVLLDIKTTQNAGYHAFQRSATNYHYYGQMAYYMRGCQAMGMDVTRAVWVVIETAPPYAVRLYYMPESAVDRCNDLIEMFLKRHAVCQMTKQWPQYMETIQALEVPDWYNNTMGDLL
jgi:hypothetical protein